MDEVVNATAAVVNATAEAAAKEPDSMMFVYTCLLVSAPVLVYYGSQRSTDQPAEETMTTKDAMMFPVVGSCVLFGMFLVFKFFAKEYINMLLHAYFIFLGAVCIGTTTLPFLARVMSEDPTLIVDFKLSIPFYHKAGESESVQATKTEAIGYGIGLIGAAWYGITKHWASNNLIGACFCVQGIEMMSIGSIVNGVVLLIGLFFYDIFWVFGTNFFMGEGNSVMVSVAKNFEAPIKLLFPKALPSVAGQFSMLGLGDIVIPGFYVAMCLRYDKTTNNVTRIFQWCFVGYCLGLGCTVFVMHVFKAAQPALLYIVPAILLFSFMGAAAAGKFNDFLWWTEEAAPKEEASPAERATAGDEDKKDK
jgi:minor histocompatibility antigen H13